MFLTRFRVNGARRDARKLLASPQAMHAAVLAGFARPEDHTAPGARTLWRLDQGGPQQHLLYIVSPGAPDLTHLVEQAGWPTTESWLTRPYRPFIDGLDKGQRWAFRLTANPVRNGRRSDDAPTQRYGHVTVTQQVDWLVARAQRNGFSIDDPHQSLLVHRRQTHKFQRGRDKSPVTLATATYDGILTIEDAGPFRSLITNGIGHARAYGCGLLTLAPVR